MTDHMAGERCNNRRHLRPHATFGDDPSGHCGCAECDGCDCTPAEPDAGDVEALREVLAGSESGNWQAYAALTALAEDILNSDWLDTLRRKAGDERAEQIAQAIERQKSIAEESRNIVQTPLPKNNFDQQAWAYGDAARIARESR